MLKNVDLIRRYCPGLAVHAFDEVARHITPDDEWCWLWDGSVNHQGYGTAGVTDPDIITVPVHRYMYDTLVGPIPLGHDVHHRCSEKSCWYPCHLEALTRKDHRHRHMSRQY